MKSHPRGSILSDQAFWIFIATILLAVVTGILNSSFFTWNNLFNVARNASFAALLAFGSMVVLFGRGLDVSIGSIVGLSGIVCAYTLAAGNSLAMGVLSGVVVGALCGLLNGYLIASLRLSALIVTIATLALFRSLALIVSRGDVYSTFGPDAEHFFQLGGGHWLGLPSVTGIMVVMAIGLMVFLRLSVWGLHLKAVGSDEASALACGVSVAPIKICSYVIGGIMAGLTGVLTVSWLGGVTSDLGSGYELTAIAAAVIGGTSLTGARISVFGTICGAFLFEVSRNSLILVGVDAHWQGFFVGIFTLAAVMIDRFRRLQ